MGQDIIEIEKEILQEVNKLIEKCDYLIGLNLDDPSLANHRSYIEGMKKKMEKAKEILMKD